MDSKKLNTFYDFAQRWSILIVVLGMSAIGTGNASGIVVWTWIGYVVLLPGAYLLVTKRIDPKKPNTLFEIAQRWSIVIVALGLSAIGTGNESGIVVWTWIGYVVFLTGAFLFVYKRVDRLGIIAAIVGGSFILFGLPWSTSVIFGKTLTEAEKSPMLLWGSILVILGLSFWAYMRSRAK